VSPLPSPKSHILPQDSSRSCDRTVVSFSSAEKISATIANRAKPSRFRVEGVEFKVEELGLGFEDLRFRVSGLEFQV